MRCLKIAIPMLALVAAAPALATWSDLAQLTASDAFDDDRFGWSCAVQGNVAVVGAPWTDGVSTQEGRAYVYLINQATGGLTEVAQLVMSTPAKSDFLGRSVAIDGDLIVVGAHQNRSGGKGTALVYEKPASGWSGTLTQSAVLVASNPGNLDYFGESVAIDGDHIVVGAWGEDTKGAAAGSAFVFARPDSGWAGTIAADAQLIPSTGSNTYMGVRVAIEDDVVIAGGHGSTVDGDNYRGQVFVFVAPDSGWAGTLEPTANLVASDGQGSDRFGRSIAISGGHIAAGAYLEEPPGSNTNHGSIYLFKQPNTGWSGTVNEIGKLRISDPSSQAKFGYEVRMEGTTVIGSSLTKEAVYVFQRPVTGWPTLSYETRKISNPTGNDDDLGNGIAVSATHILVGAPYDDMVTANAGRAYLLGPVAADVGDDVPGPGPVAVRAAPNPFNPRTVVNFVLDQDGFAELAIYDVAGRHVRTLASGPLAAGPHRRTWDGLDDRGRARPSGVYFARVRAAQAQGTVKLMLVR